MTASSASVLTPAGKQFSISVPFLLLSLVHLHPFNIINFINLEGICTSDKEEIKLCSNSHVQIAI